MRQYVLLKVLFSVHFSSQSLFFFLSSIPVEERKKLIVSISELVSKLKIPVLFKNKQKTQLHLNSEPSLYFIRDLGS